MMGFDFRSIYLSVYIRMIISCLDYAVGFIGMYFRRVLFNIVACIVRAQSSHMDSKRRWMGSKGYDLEGVDFSGYWASYE